MSDGNSSPSLFEINIGSSTVQDAAVQPSSVVGSLDGIDASGVTTNVDASLYGRITGNLTDSISGFERIIRFDVNGQVQSSIVSGADLTTLGSWFEFGSVSSAGSLTIDRLQRLSIAGNLAGNITADSLTSLIEIGVSQTGTSAITLGSASGNVEVSGTLLRLVVSGAMTGDILAGNLGGTSLPPVNIGTTFTGSLICNGDVNNVVRLGTDWAGTDELFIIGGSLPNRPDDTGPQGNRMILLVDPSPSSGTTSNTLEHQIVINAN